MKFVENREAGRGVREFHNIGPIREDRRLGHLDLGWASVVKQYGTMETTGRIEYVVVVYRKRRWGRRSRRFKGYQASKVLEAVQEHRSDTG